MDLFSEINELMVKHRFRPNKKTGQNFIICEEIITKMLEEAALSPKDKVLEIGAGTGFLTREMLKVCKVMAIEVDDLLADLLEKELPKKNLELIRGNFLETKVTGINKVVSLPPYTISSPIMYKLFELKPKLCVFVFQKEFVERFSAEPGFMDYNALSVLTQYYFKTKTISKVASNCFFPQPNTESCIVKLTAWNQNGTVKNEKAFHAFIKSIFRFQNKNLLNAVKNSAQFLKEEFADFEKTIELIKKNKLSSTKVNLISCKEFVKLFNTII